MEFLLFAGGDQLLPALVDPETHSGLCRTEGRAVGGRSLRFGFGVCGLLRGQRVQV